MTDDRTGYREDLRRELKKIFLKTLLLRLTSGLVSFVALSSWIFLGVVIWAALTEAPPLWQVLTVSRVMMIAVAMLFLGFVLFPLVRMPGLRKLAFEVENRRDFKDIVAAGYEFSHDSFASGYSPELVREVVRRAVRSLSGLQVRFLFLNRRQALLVPVAYTALFVIGLLAVTSPKTLFEAGRRVTVPEEASAVVHEANLHGSPGNITVLAGSDVEVSAIDFGGSQQAVQLSYNLSEGFWKTEPVTMSAKTPINEYSYTFKDVRSSVNYYFQAGEKRSPTYKIDVVHKPIVTDLNVVLTPPAYTGEEPVTLIDSGGNIQALEGTHVAVHAQANNTLKDASVSFEDGKSSDVTLDGRLLAFDFVALKDGSYSIRLQDDLDHKTDEPLVYGIEVYQDNRPVLDVLKPGTDATLPRNLRVDVGFIASDDYGIEKADIFYRKGGEERYARTRISLGDNKSSKEIVQSFVWDLGGVTLFPGNYVEYFLQVEDNNVVTGPGITKSRVFYISVPTMAELYQDIKEEDAKRADLFEEAIKESQEFKERIEKLAREFKKTEELDWSQKKEIDKAVSSQEEIQQKLEEIQNSLEETMQSLSDNQMTSQQIGEKMEEINKLLEDIDSEELNKYVDELRKAMEKLSPEEIRQALEKLNLSAEELLKSLERTESLLREIQQEQQMEELVRKTRDLIEAQEELMEKTEDTEAGDEDGMGDLSEEQQELAEKADDLEKSMEEMSETMQDSELGEEMKEMANELSESNTSQQMKQASESLQQGQKQQAMQKQEQALDNMISLFNRMAGMQMAMQQNAQNQTAENLQRLAKSTLELSFKQEGLTNRVREQVSAKDISNINALTQEQQTYVNAIRQISNELYELSKKSLAVPEGLLQVLGQTIDNMQTSLLFLEQNKAFMSTTSSTQAITNLNLVTMELLAACQSCSSSGGGQSAGTPMLQQLLQGQQQLLQQSESILQMRAAQEQLLQQKQAAIQRLAGQQRSLQELAKDIEKDLKGNRVLGRMDKAIQDMEEVLRDFDSGIVNEQTLRKEEKILSRLLDAQRSVHSRDYEKKRHSVSAGDIFSETLGGAASKNSPQLLREEIRRAMSLKAPGEFEDLIRLYFRALAEEATTESSKE